MRTARAKGLAERRVVLLHGFVTRCCRWSRSPGCRFSRLLGGAVVIETVFALPGFGRYGVDAIFIRDYPVVQAVVLMTAVIVVLTNLLTDLLYGVLDPRIGSLTMAASTSPAAAAKDSRGERSAGDRFCVLLGAMLQTRLSASHYFCCWRSCCARCSRR